MSVRNTHRHTYMRIMYMCENGLYNNTDDIIRTQAARARHQMI